MADFAQTIATAYAVYGAALDLGRGVHDGEQLEKQVMRGVFGLLKKKH